MSLVAATLALTSASLGAQIEALLPDPEFSNARILAIGETVTRQLASGEVHTYRIPLRAGVPAVMESWVHPLAEADDQDPFGSVPPTLQFFATGVNQQGSMPGFTGDSRITALLPVSDEDAIFVISPLPPSLLDLDESAEERSADPLGYTLTLHSVRTLTLAEGATLEIELGDDVPIIALPSEPGVTYHLRFVSDTSSWQTALIGDARHRSSGIGFVPEFGPTRPSDYPTVRDWQYTPHDDRPGRPSELPIRLVVTRGQGINLESAARVSVERGEWERDSREGPWQPINRFIETPPGQGPAGIP